MINQNEILTKILKKEKVPEEELKEYQEFLEKEIGEYSKALETLSESLKKQLKEWEKEIPKWKNRRNVKRLKS